MCDKKLLDVPGRALSTRLRVFAAKAQLAEANAKGKASYASRSKFYGRHPSGQRCTTLAFQIWRAATGFCAPCSVSFPLST